MVCMAKIVLSDAAPKDSTLTFSLVGAEPFQAPYETDNGVVLAGAAAHPWLAIEREPVAVETTDDTRRLDPEADPFSSSYTGDPIFTPQGDDPAEVTPVAINAALDQTKSVEEGGVAETLAADPTTDTTTSSRKRTTKES